MGQKTLPTDVVPTFPSSAVVPTPSDTVDTISPGVLYCGGGGNVQVTTESGDQVTFNGIQGGTTIPVRIRRVWATGLTASSLVLIY